MEQMIRWFASNQIRNVAALAGNICTASPISDLNPVLMALGASLSLHRLMVQIKLPHELSKCVSFSLDIARLT